MNRSDNKTNNEGCQYDGGDCCGSNFNILHIIYGTKCQCLLGDNPLVPAATVSNSGDCINLAWVGDGYGDDSTNNEACGYDGGNCCGANVLTEYCSEFFCHPGGTTAPLESCPNESWIGNNYC